MMAWLIWLGYVGGYLLISCLVFRMILVWYIDHETEDYRKNDRDDLIEEDLGWVLAGAFFWPVTMLGYLFYKVIIKQLWSRPTPGEKRDAEAKARAQNEH